MQNLLENTISNQNIQADKSRILTAIAILLHANSLSRMALQLIGG